MSFFTIAFPKGVESPRRFETFGVRPGGKTCAEAETIVNNIVVIMTWRVWRIFIKFFVRLKSLQSDGCCPWHEGHAAETDSDEIVRREALMTLLLSQQDCVSRFEKRVIKPECSTASSIRG